MLYERILDLAPEMRTDRGLSERVAARFATGLLLALPVCIIASLALVAAVAYALAIRTCEAGLWLGRLIREGLFADRLTQRSIP